MRRDMTRDVQRTTRRNLDQLLLGLTIVGAAILVVVALANGYPWRWFEHGPDQLQQHDDIQAARAEPPVHVTARTFSTDYAEHEVRADALYRGRMLVITGLVAGVFYDQATGEPVVMLGDRGMLEDGEPDDVRARFDAGNDELRRLRVGQRVTVECLADPTQGAPVPRVWHCTVLR